MAGQGSASTDGTETMPNKNGKGKGVCIIFLKNDGRMRIGFDRRDSDDADNRQEVCGRMARKMDHASGPRVAK